MKDIIDNNKKLKVGVITLGCDKNRVDTENLITNLASVGFEFVGEIENADIILINTCAFLEAARVEAIDEIINAGQFKANGSCKCLVVAGCLPMKYESDLAKELPEVDIWLTPKDYYTVGETVSEFLKNELNDIDGLAKVNEGCDSQLNACYEKERNVCCDKKAYTSRLLTTPPHYAYLKIADGCSNHCTFCMIPSIRGDYYSIAPDKLVAEAKALVDGGVRELILVAQDTTRYGSDKEEFGTLATLVNRLSQIEDLEIIRLLYCYPDKITDELIETIATNNKVAKYIDIPLQHVNNSVLKLMGRKSTRESIEALIKKLRERIPQITIRTTFMVGFPQETIGAIDELCDFLTVQKLDNVGFFAYSFEEETPSARISGHMSEEEKQHRLEQVMNVQQKVMEEKLATLIGMTQRVQYESIDYERNKFVGRTVNQAPDVDGVVYFEADFVDVGQWYDVLILSVDGSDLIGKLIK